MPALKWAPLPRGASHARARDIADSRIGHDFSQMRIHADEARETDTGPKETAAKAPTEEKPFASDAQASDFVTELDVEGFVERLTTSDEISKLVGKFLVDDFDQAATTKARKKAAKEALRFYDGLLEREAKGDLTLQEFRLEYFTPQKLSLMYSAAAAKIKSSKPAKKTEGEKPATTEPEAQDTTIPKPTHASDGGRWLLGTYLEPQTDEPASAWAPKVKTPSTAQAIKSAKNVTVGQTLKTLSETMTADPEIVGGKKLEASLYACTKLILVVAQHMYFLDRSGFINFDAMERMGHYFATLQQSLPPGTYYVMQRSIATSKSVLSGSARVILQLDKGVSVWQGGDFVMGTVVQHEKAKRMFGDILGEAGGILITVPAKSEVSFGDSVGNLASAIERAVYYMPWAVRKIVGEMEVLDVLIDAAVEAGIEKLAKAAPIAGQVLMALDMFDRALWFGAAAETAMQAQSEDEIDIAAQAMAYGVAQSVVEEVTEKGVDIAAGGAKKAFGKKKDAPAESAAEKPLTAADESETAETPRESVKAEPKSATADAKPPTEQMMTPPSTPSAQAATTGDASKKPKPKPKLKSPYDFDVTPSDLFVPSKGSAKNLPPSTAFSGDPKSVEALYDQLSKGVVAAPSVDMDIVFLKHKAYGPRTQDSQLALKTYSLAVSASANFQAYEVGLYYNSESDEFQVNVGDGNSVSAPTGDNWTVVIHFHPNENEALSFRLPSPQDFSSLVLRATESNPAPRSFVEYPLPQFKDQRGVTEFGYDPTNPKPFYVKVTLPNGETNIAHFYDMKEYAAFLDQETKFLDPDSESYKQMAEGEPAPGSQAMMSGDKNGVRVTPENLEQVTDELGAIGTKYPKFLKEQVNLKYNKIVADLKQTPGKSARYVESVIPKIWAAIRDPKNFAALISEIQSVRDTITAADKSAYPGLTEDTIAVLKMAQERGIEVQIISPELGEIQDFIGQVVAKPQAFLDMNAAALFPGHGATPHLMQEIIVDRLLVPLGSSASEFRLALGDLRASNELGARIWQILFDPQYLDVNKPEALFPAIKKWLPNLQ